MEKKVTDKQKQIAEIMTNDLTWAVNCYNFYSQNKMKQLEYGKWYSCKEGMPEDFTALSEYDGVTFDVVGACDGRDDYVLLYREHTYGKWQWNHIVGERVTHWLALPPLNEE